MSYNILLDNLPTETPNGFKIDSDFREWIKFELLMQDNRISAEEKVGLIINLLFFDIPNDIEKALTDVVWFYKCGKEEKVKKSGNNRKTRQIYSFEHDASYIFSGFMADYNIDLNNVEMHWWKFKALFEGLSDKTKIVEIMGYRATDLSKIKDKNEKSRYKKLKEIYKLPDMRTAEEKEAEFGSAFW